MGFFFFTQPLRRFEKHMEIHTDPACWGSESPPTSVSPPAQPLWTPRGSDHVAAGSRSGKVTLALQNIPWFSVPCSRLVLASSFP